MNKSNELFYKNISPKKFEDISKFGDFENSPELDIIRINKLILNSKSILELGAGYGRIIDNLLIRNYPGNICGIERNKQYFDYMKIKYKNKSKIELLNCDILNDRLPNSSLGILMWNTITEFSKEEQSKLLIKLNNCERLLVTSHDYNYETQHLKDIGGQNRSFKYLNETIKLRIPLIEDMEKWAKENKRTLTHFKDIVGNNYHRIFYILE